MGQHIEETAMASVRPLPARETDFALLIAAAIKAYGPMTAAQTQEHTRLDDKQTARGLLQAMSEGWLFEGPDYRWSLSPLPGDLDDTTEVEVITTPAGRTPVRFEVVVPAEREDDVRICVHATLHPDHRVSDVDHEVRTVASAMAEAEENLDATEVLLGQRMTLWRSQAGHEVLFTGLASESAPEGDPGPFKAAFYSLAHLKLYVLSAEEFLRTFERVSREEVETVVDGTLARLCDDLRKVS